MNEQTQEPEPSVEITTRRIFLSDGTEAATQTIGPAPGHDNLGDIVICHGTPWSSRMWLPHARELGRSHRVLLWDMPGYGESIAEAALPVDLVTQGRRLAELMTVWDAQFPQVIAHDIGGAVALGAHLFGGSEFASLYLLDIVTLPPWGSPFFRLVADNESVFTSLPPQLHRALVTEYIAGAGGARLERSWAEILAEPWCTVAGQAAFYHQIASLRPEHTEPIVEGLGEVRCPVRIGWGAEDPWIPFGQAEQLAQRLPGTADITSFRAAGHLVPVESPQELSDDLAAWLGSVPLSPTQISAT